MDFESRIATFGRCDRTAIRKALDAAADKYDAAVLDWANTQATYTKAIALTLAVLATEDGHYYEIEHAVMTYLMKDDIVKQMRTIANEIIQTDNLIGAVIQVQGLFDRLSYSAVYAALDLSVCYFLLTGGITASRRKLLKDLFGSRR